MAETIKRLGVPIGDPAVEDELDHLIEQIEHKDNLLKKEDGETEEVTISGTTLIFVNGQFRGVK